MYLKQPIATLHKSELKMEGVAIPNYRRATRKKMATKKAKKGSKKSVSKRKVVTYKMILS